jgi:threonine dehydrogenase-like Zn-dependent dehydrogenase
MSADHPNPDGFFGNAGCAEYVVSSEVACYKIDEGIDPSVAALLEPLGTCCAGFRRFGCDFGDTVVVVGAGTMGILNALVAKAHGCRVLITEMMPKKLEAARRLGLEAIDVSACDPVEKVKELTGGRGADGVIVAVAAGERLRPGHRYAQGEARSPAHLRRRLPAPKWELDPNTVHYRRMVIVGTYGADYVDFKEAANLINMRAANFEELVEEKIPLDQIQHAFERACEPACSVSASSATRSNACVIRL